MLFRSDAAVIQFYSMGIGLGATFLILLGWTTLTFLITFYLIAGLFDKLVIQKMDWQKKFKRWHWVRKIKKSIKRGEKKTLAWFLRHNKILIFVILFIPFTPCVESIAIMAARIASIKGALPLLLLANAGKILLMCLLVYRPF